MLLLPEHFDIDKLLIATTADVALALANTALLNILTSLIIYYYLIYHHHSCCFLAAAKAIRRLRVRVRFFSAVFLMTN